MSTIPAVQATEEVKLNAYFSNPKSMQIISSRGKAMVFINGRYVTKDASEIADLETICALRPNGSVFKDPAMLQLTESQLDPMNALREHFRKEFEAEKAAHMNPEQDFGNSIQERMKATSTSSIKAVTSK